MPTTVARDHGRKEFYREIGLSSGRHVDLGDLPGRTEGLREYPRPCHHRGICVSCSNRKRGAKHPCGYSLRHARPSGLIHLAMCGFDSTTLIKKRRGPNSTLVTICSKSGSNDRCIAVFFSGRKSCKCPKIITAGSTVALLYSFIPACNPSVDWLISMIRSHSPMKPEILAASESVRPGC